MKEKEKKKNGTEAEKEKDPNQKEFSLLSNMVYVLKGTLRFQKLLAFFLVFSVLSRAAATYLPTFALSAVIDQVTRRAEFDDLLKTVLLFFVGMLVTDAVGSFSNAHIWWRYIDARVQFMMLRIRKVLYMDYEHLE